uniref:Eukaryotic translation initiation factor 4B n=1 Tax=Saimiri boliviensis boliviensis TaxID=39432 RepID=A0A2K6UKB6_SAIBB
AKKKKKGKTISLIDFLAEDGGLVEETPVSKPVSWADESDGLEGDHCNDDNVHRVPPIDCFVLPTASQAAREPNIDQSCLPKLPPYTAFLGKLPYDVTEESIKELFRGLNISEVHLPCEPSNPERLKDFGYAEFEDLDSLFSALSLSEESLGNRTIRVAVDKDRDDRSFGHDRNQDSDKTDIDWRAHPATESFDDYLPRRGDDNLYYDGYRDGPCRSRHYDRGYDSQIGSGRRAFGSGYCRDDDYRGGGDHDYSWDYYRCDDRGPCQRPKLHLKPQSTPKEDDSSATASIFGGAKSIHTAAREREEQEKLQRQLDEPKLERWPWERYPSRTGSESSQTRTSITSHRNARRRESEKSPENEILNKEEGCHSATSKPPKPDQSLKEISNPPAPSQSLNTEQQTPKSSGGKVVPERPARKDENKVDGMNVPKSQSRNSSRGPRNRGNKDHWKESDRKDSKKDQDSISAPEPKKPEENPASKFSSAALFTDGEDENKVEDYTK